MLAGTVYFYDNDEKLIEEMDLYDYEKMSKESFLHYVETIKATKVTLGAIYHGRQLEEHLSEIYNSKG